MFRLGVILRPSPSAILRESCGIVILSPHCFLAKARSGGERRIYLKEKYYG